MKKYPRPSTTTSNKPPTLGPALAKLLEHTAARVRKRLRAPATLAMQQWHVGWLAGQLGADRPLSEVTHAVISELVERMASLSPRTIAKRLSTLRRALRLAVGRGELAALAPFPEIANPAWRPTTPHFSTVEQLRRLLAVLPLNRAEWCSVTVWTLQRPSDVERMTWADVDLESTPVTVRIRSTKTRRPQGIRVKCPAPLVLALAQRRDRLIAAGLPPAAGDPLIDPWPGSARTLPLVCVRHGLPPLTGMGLRHTGISWMVRRTGLTVAAQRWGGWSNFSMMEAHYAHALPAQLAQASDELASIALERRRPPARAERRPPARRAAR